MSRIAVTDANFSFDQGSSIMGKANKMQTNNNTEGTF